MNRRAIALSLATAIAVPAEGLRQYAYLDPPGILSVCYGSTTDVQRDRFYSVAECRTRLNADMNGALDIVERCAPGLPERALAAFGDAVYNIGPRIVCDTATSTAARLLEVGQVDAACRELPRWNKARILGVLTPLPGLSKRRRAEMTLCLGLV